MLKYIIGKLATVSNLSRGSSTIFWTPPFSLDLTGIDPDIVYCVEVYNITCGRRDLVISDCNVTESFYTSDNVHDGFLYNITVIPRSNVHNARIGNSTINTGITLLAIQDFVYMY